MPVIALQSKDLHRDAAHPHQSISVFSGETGEPIRGAAQLTSPVPISGPLTSSPPTMSSTRVPGITQSLPTSEPRDMAPLSSDRDPSAEAGPSQHRSRHQHHNREHSHGRHEHWSSHERQPSIPPPANPRRHRSGVLMSQVRSRTQTQTGDMRMSAGSRSYGDLMGLQMSSTTTERRASEVRDSSMTRDQRVTSDGSRRTSVDNDEAVWDNSARFYHHLHSISRPASRQTSPERQSQTSRDVSPSPSTSSSPIRNRQHTHTPHSHGNHHPHHSPTAALSPSHAFLQSHLPPLFPQPSPGSSPGDHHGVSQSMVILTPTTAEWKEIKREARGEMERSGSESSSDRRSSIASSGSSDEDVKPSGLMLSHTKVSPRSMKRPSLQSAISADYLSREQTHTPDPGASPEPKSDPLGDHLTPARAVFQSNIIAPSPIVTDTDRLVTSPLPSHPQDNFNFPTSSSADDIIITPRESSEDSPQRFNSIGRRESLRATRPAAGEIRKKTKRELERERLFKNLDEELEADKEAPTSFEPVTEIGGGLRLTADMSRPLSLDGSNLRMPASAAFTATPGELGRSVTAPEIAKRAASESTPAPEPAPATEPLPAAAAEQKSPSPTKSLSIASVSPSQPVRPSPLHASPLTAKPELSSPGESPGIVDLSAEDSSLVGSPPPPASAVAGGNLHRTPSNHVANLETIRDYARSLTEPEEPTREIPNPLSPPTEAVKSPRIAHRRDTKRVSLVAGRVVQPFTVPPDTALPPPAISIDEPPTRPSFERKVSLNAFSPFRTPALTPSNSAANTHALSTPSGGRGYIPPSFARQDSTVSIAPSIAPPSEPGTPTSETTGGLGGRGISDYAILSEAGKGAYGLVMRAKVKGPGGEPVGEEVIIKYIVKARILADCWKKHRILGPIPVEIHVMDQLRHLLYHTPPTPAPWDPSRPHPGAATSPKTQEEERESPASPPPAEAEPRPKQPLHLQTLLASERPPTPDSARSSPRSLGSSAFNAMQKGIAAELRVSPERGHPNLCKLLDFFEDREFYYMVMPRFGSGLDLFDRVEASPNGLPAFEIRSLIGQLADGLRFLHLNGIVHRDIKDENVILDGAGRCQLIDFGSAAHWRPGKRWDTFSGTLHYASPEILRGDPFGGKEQDVYALGTVLYVLLVGETPFAELPDEVLIGLAEGSRALEALKDRCEGRPYIRSRNSVDGKGVEDAGSVNGSDGDKASRRSSREVHPWEIDGEEDGGGKLADAEDLVRRCLELEVADRPPAEMICQHRFLRGANGWVGYRGWIKPKAGSR